MQLCAGVTAAGKTLPAGFSVQTKAGINYGDVSAYNSLIQTSLQLKPAGLIVFPNGPEAQTPILNTACAQGVKIMTIDSPATGINCLAGQVGANHYEMGVEAGQWLIAHPPASKEVGIVTLQPGEYQSNDDRVKGFTQTVEAAGFKVAATVVTTNALDQTRSLVTNMVTAHPNLGAIFSANGGMGAGTQQALLKNHTIVQITLDVDPTTIPSILSGAISADVAQDPYNEGLMAVQFMAKAIEGQKIPATTYTKSLVVDKTNTAQYLAAQKH